MTEAAPNHPLRQAFGPPTIAATPMAFRSAYLNHTISRHVAETGAGWFLGKMFYLLGERLERLEPCVRAWSFLLPAELTDWVIIGFNVYGQILLLDQAGDRGTMAPVGVLDPFTASYLASPDLDITSLLCDRLPNRTLPGFVDTHVYQQFLAAADRMLDDDEILGIERAIPLGGDLALANFSVINIIDYYNAVGPVYANALAELDHGRA